MLLRLLLILSFTPIISYSQTSNLTALQVVENSIAYHDPKDMLQYKTTILELRETRPNGPDRKTSLSWNIAKESYQKKISKDDKKIVSFLNKGVVSFYIDNKETISSDELKKYKLTTDRELMFKNYYQYLWLLPMKLRDEGTIIDPLVKTVDFFGKRSLQVKVTYEPAIGKDTWYFYVHPETYALQGYRFYHDESKNDGEYILLSGETSYKSVRLPKKRAWYTHKEDKFLGADILETLSLK